MVGLFVAQADAQYKGAAMVKAAAEKDVKVGTCYTCHDPVKQLHTMGKHSKVNCSKCHAGLEKHAANPGPDTRPATNTLLGSVRPVSQGTVPELHEASAPPARPR